MTVASTYFAPPESVIAKAQKREAYPDFFRVADGLLAGTADIDTNDYEVEFGKTVITPGPLDEANVVTSRVGVGETHKVAIDLDMDAALIPSTTPGHHHLIIDHQMSWDDYSDLLHRLCEVGLIQEGYLNASLKRGATVLRTPWTKKGAA